jgi:AcrR family transcriptional regulator
VSRVTRFQDRVRRSLREELLDAAATLLPEKGFHGLRMADVATAAGVSRQTVYNEFGNKEALVSAVSLRTEVVFLDEIAARMRATESVVDGLRGGVRWAIEDVTRNPLVSATLGTGAAQDLLPFLTASKAEPLLHSARAALGAVLAERVPTMDIERAEVLAEQAFRLVISHVTLPTTDAAQAAETITRLLTPQLSTAPKVSPGTRKGRS